MTMMTIEKTDVAVIAKEIRGLIKPVKTAVFSVRINRQWENVKNEPRSVIYVRGGCSPRLPGQHLLDKLTIAGMMKDVAEEHNLELIDDLQMDHYILVQHH